MSKLKIDNFYQFLYFDMLITFYINIYRVNYLEITTTARAP